MQRLHINFFHLFYTCVGRPYAAWHCYIHFKNKVATAQILLKSRSYYYARYLVRISQKVGCTFSDTGGTFRPLKICFRVVLVVNLFAHHEGIDAALILIKKNFPISMHMLKGLS